MDLGDFKNEIGKYTTKRYLVEISPRMDVKTYIDEAKKIYQIALTNLFIENFELRSPELKQIYKNALLYFRGDDRSDWDLNKGLFIMGGTGSGKSIFFDIFKIYTTGLNHNSFVKSKQTKIVAEVGKNGINELDKYIKEKNSVILYIDDFGSNASLVTHYGTTFNVMDELIQGRYDEFIKTGALTHISTNVLASEMKDKFDERITSRMNQMFNVIPFPNNDYRK